VSAPALEIQHITRRFGQVVALADANLSVATGSVHAVLGENGAGKTTLMRVAYGLLRPDSGVLRIDGSQRAFGSPGDAIAAGVGMVQQHPSNVGAMTVWENVVLGGAGRVRPDRTTQEVQALIGSLGFGLDPMARVANIPVASQQRLEIVKAVYHKARLLILDEPTAILAPEEAKELYLWLRGFVERGGTAIVVTHKLEEARRYADDVTVLRAGRTVLQARSSSVTTEQLTDAMLGESLNVAPRAGATRDPGPSVFRATGLSLLSDRGIPVIREASFQIRSGEIMGIAGVEGSGHHELLLAIAGRQTPVSGSIESQGGPSIVPEDRHRDSVVQAFTLSENALVKNAGVRSGRLHWRNIAEEVRGFIGGYDVRASGPEAVMRTLSGGNQQKFVLARELNGDPSLVVAENPTRGLDIRAAAFVREQLRAARDRGAAVVLYSSDLDEILELADRVLVVHSGAVTEAPLDRGRIGAAMLGAA
jgi:general nucleoside transport system ATP-binding protein